MSLFNLIGLTTDSLSLRLHFALQLRYFILKLIYPQLEAENLVAVNEIGEIFEFDGIREGRRQGETRLRR